ncbi:MAG: 2TM domain-containing protein [Burkholderiales bacterium]|nr:2TM domain-containing protein [Burkholderiales bacterium]
MEPRDLHAIARRRANAKLGFLIHLAAFVGVNVLLWAINAQFAPQSRWSVVPLAGWAIGLAIHGLVVLLLTSGVRERMVASEMRRLAARPPHEPPHP